MTTAAVYFLTNTGGTSSRYYWECRGNPWTPSHDRFPVVGAPTAVEHLPGRDLQAADAPGPRSTSTSSSTACTTTAGTSRRSRCPTSTSTTSRPSSARSADRPVPGRSGRRASRATARARRPARADTPHGRRARPDATTPTHRTRPAEPHVCEQTECCVTRRGDRPHEGVQMAKWKSPTTCFAAAAVAAADVDRPHRLYLDDGGSSGGVAGADREGGPRPRARR